MTDLLCLPLEAELVNIPPNKGNNRAHGQNLAILSTGLRVWWPSRTNVIIIRTSQHYVAFPHPPYVHSIEWIFFFFSVFPISFPLFPFFWHMVYQRKQHSAEHCMPDASLWHFVSLGLSESWFRVIVGLQYAGLDLDAKKSATYSFKCELRILKLL